MPNLQRLTLIANEAASKARQFDRMADEIRALEERVLVKKGALSNEQYLVVLREIAEDSEVVESLRELRRLNVTSTVIDSHFAKRQVGITERGNIEISSGVTKESLRHFLGLN